MRSLTGRAGGPVGEEVRIRSPACDLAPLCILSTDGFLISLHVCRSGTGTVPAQRTFRDVDPPPPERTWAYEPARDRADPHHGDRPAGAVKVAAGRGAPARRDAPRRGDQGGADREEHVDGLTELNESLGEASFAPLPSGWAR